MSHKLLYFTSYFLKRLEKYNFPNINQLIALSELGSIAGAGNIDRLNYSQSPLYINTINVPLARNIPSFALSSGDNSNISFPLKVIEPPSTV